MEVSLLGPNMMHVQNHAVEGDSLVPGLAQILNPNMEETHVTERQKDHVNVTSNLVQVRVLLHSNLYLRLLPLTYSRYELAILCLSQELNGMSKLISIYLYMT